MFDASVLISFLAVAQTGGFSAAARQLGLRQSTVSGHIARLEKTVGRELFVRDTHSVELTVDGSAMVGFARSILDSHESATRYFAGDAITGKLRFGASEDLVALELPEILREFRIQHPMVDLELHVGLSEELHAQLSTGQLDMVFGKRRSGDKHGQLVWTDRLIWAGAPEFAYGDGPVPLVTYPPPSLTRESAIRTLESAGLGYRVSCVSDSQLGLRAAALAGLGVLVHSRSLLPAGLVEVTGLPDPGDIEFVLINRSRIASRPERALAEAILSNAHRLHTSPASR